jgi:hypothetical protein
MGAKLVGGRAAARKNVGKYSEMRGEDRSAQEHVGISNIYYCVVAADPTNERISSVVPSYT